MHILTAENIYKSFDGTEVLMEFQLTSQKEKSLQSSGLPARGKARFCVVYHNWKRWIRAKLSSVVIRW